MANEMDITKLSYAQLQKLIQEAEAARDAKRGEELKLINRVLSDVNNLVAKKIDIDDIKAERYYAKDKDDDVFS